MAASNRKFRRLASACALACICAAPAHPAGLIPKPTQQPIDVTAQFEEVDAKNKTIFLRKVRIAQGDMILTADQGQAKGTGVESAFDNSVWVFKGTVKVTLEAGSLNSDEAQVTFTNKVLSKAVVTGQPATFQQKIPKSDKTATGHANSIDYDVSKGLVHLTRDAYLNNGQVEVHGESLKYDIARQVSSAEAADQDSQRVHFVITPPPPKSGPPPASTPAPTPAAPAAAPPAAAPPNP
jgi:lipopolysaccharide transport protein LptA